jgi:hypothetical protein
MLLGDAAAIVAGAVLERVSHLTSRLWAMLALAVLLAAAVLGGACKGGDNSKDKKAAEDAVQAMVAAYTDKDVDGFVAAFTDKGLAELFGVSEEELDAAKEDLAQFIGEDPPVVRGFSNTKVSGDTVTTEVENEGEGVIAIDRFTLMRDGTDWLVDGFEGFAVSPDIPSGYKTVDLQVNEFAFGFIKDEVSTGKIAFKVENVGKQTHEVPLVKLPEGFDLDAAIQAEAESGEGFNDAEFLGRIEIEPGAEYNMVFLDDLEPGRYALVCFFPDTEDPEETPHALKGMTAEFELQ